MRIPLLGEDDARLLQSYLGGICCGTCASSNRAHWSVLISCSILGVGLNDATQVRWRWATHLWRERVRRIGVFDRLKSDRVFAPFVDWDLVDDGNFVANNPFARGEPRKRLLATYTPIVEGERFERRRRLAEAAGGAGDGLAVRSLKVGELRNLTPQAKRLMTRRAKRGCGGGADAIAGVGEDFYVQTVNVLAQPIEEEVLRMARLDRDPARRLDAWLVDNFLPNRKLVAVPPSWLKEGQTWRVNLLPAKIVASPGGLLLDLDSRLFELDGLDRVPADFGHIKIPRVIPRMSLPVPF